MPVEGSCHLKKFVGRKFVHKQNEKLIGTIEQGRPVRISLKYM
jgi:hypothetical protein